MQTTIIHIAGTNGKGSTASYVMSGLQSLGYTVNATMSPHLLRINERILLHGKPVDDVDLSKSLQAVEQKNYNNLNLSFFHKITQAAFLLFEQYPADYTILETGLGGRLDPTNVIIDKHLIILTRIGLDHQDLLGSTLSSIATEKCGIMRAGVPVVTCVQPDEVTAVIKGHAHQLNAPLYLSRNIEDKEFESYHAVNAGLAYTALTDGLGLKGIDASLFKAARLPGRRQMINLNGKTVMLDMAHNADGFKALRNQNSDAYIVWTLQSKKDLLGVVHALGRQSSGYVDLGTGFYCTADVLALDPEIHSIQMDTIEKTIHSSEKPVIICGSVHLLEKIINLA